jgi:hypothetical protein
VLYCYSFQCNCKVNDKLRKATIRVLEFKNDPEKQNPINFHNIKIKEAINKSNTYQVDIITVK